jgi:hypothetical protein
MSLVDRKVSPRQVAANQSNAQHSTGPKTPEGKARVSLNALKTGAYAKGEDALRQILLKSGEDPQEREQVERDLMASWQPDDTMQAIMVQGIADKTWDLLQLRGLRRQSQLTALLIDQIQTQQRQLLSRRWLPGCPTVKKEAQGLWLAKDSGSKFKTIFDILDDLQKWFENYECPDEYPQAMRDLYGECPSLAGERIRLLFIQLFDTDEEGAAEKAALELPKWIAQERRDVQQEQDLYRREWELRTKGPNVTAEQVAAKEAALERQIAEQIRLLLQLKSKRSLWPSQFEAGETAAGGGAGAQAGTVAQSEDGSQGKGPQENGKGNETVAGDPVAAENAQKGQSKPSGSVESAT